MTQKRILTGIKPTGAPHIGNYFGALKPAIDLMSAPNQDGFLFVADFHALNLAKERENLAQNSLEMAASLLAMGLDPKKVTFYRQSDVPEIFELTAIITPFTPKGLMNRAHAYKAAWVDFNQTAIVSLMERYNITPEQIEKSPYNEQTNETDAVDSYFGVSPKQKSIKIYAPDGDPTRKIQKIIANILCDKLSEKNKYPYKIIVSGKDGMHKRLQSDSLPAGHPEKYVGLFDPDSSINMGLYNYPILMTADILSFDVDLVPIGRDQRQHLEFARDIAASINSFYKADLLKQPDSFFAEEVEELPGLDGRKMSKSYGNTIPVFAQASEVLKACKRITTDSRTPDEPKDKESLIYKLYKAYATASELADFEQRFLGGGMGYGAAKQEIADLHEARFAKGREEYKRLVADPAYVKSILQDGAAKARPLAQATLKRVRDKMGFY